MDQPKIKYRPLTRATAKLFALFNVRYRLWITDDYILNQEMRGYSESSKRFYFNDIQAIVVTRSNTGFIMDVVCLGLLLIFGVPALVSIFSSTAASLPAYFWCGPLAVLFFLIMIVNITAGPTCKTRLYTAVQVEELVSLSRLRTAKKVVAQIKPMIEAAQGRLTLESVEAFSAAAVPITPAASAGTAAPQPFAVAPAPEPEVHHESGNWHAAFFAINLLFALSALIDIFWQHHMKNVIDTIMLLPFVALAVAALLKQRHSDLPQSIKVMPWLCLGFMVLTFLFMVVYGPIYVMSHPEIIKSGAMPERLEGPAFLVYLTIEAVAYSSLGLIGLLRINRFQAAHTAAEAGAGSAAGAEADDA